MSRPMFADALRTFIRSPAGFFRAVRAFPRFIRLFWRLFWVSSELRH